MLDEHTQLAVIRGLQNGSREDWARLYDGYSVEVWRYVARLLGPDAAAVADVVQEAFLEAARSARHFNPSRGTLWNWLAGIAHHRVSAYWRQTSRLARLQKLAESGAAEVRHLFDDGEQSAKALGDDHDTADFVRSMLAQIPADYAALLTAKYLDDRSLIELSQQWGSSIEAIKSKLARARREFRTKCDTLATGTATGPTTQTVIEKRP